MANRFYQKAGTKFQQGQINLLTDTILGILVAKSGYTPNTNTDEFLSDIPGGAIVASGVALSSRVANGFQFQAANTTWSAVTTGLQVDFIVLYKSTGVAGTSSLIGIDDTAMTFPVLTNGGNLTAGWFNGVVFTL